MNLLARFISILLHPLLMATYLFSLFVFFLPVGLDPLTEEVQWNVILIIFCATFVLPALNVGLFKAFGMVKTLTMENRKERILPFVLITILYIGFTYVFYSKTRIGVNDNLFKFLLLIDLLVLVAGAITFFYKVSVHSLAWWGLVGILLPLNKVSEEGALFYPTIGAIVLAGLVMSARLQLNAHNPREVMIGAMVGLTISFVGMTVLF